MNGANNRYTVLRTAILELGSGNGSLLSAHERRAIGEAFVDKILNYVNENK